MIPIDPIKLFVVPVIIALAVLLVLFLIYEYVWFSRQKTKSETIYRCLNCNHIYVALNRTPLASCPKCGKQNSPAQQQ